MIQGTLGPEINHFEALKGWCSV